MGWGRFLLLGDIGQQLDLSDLNFEHNRLKRDANWTGRQTRDLQERVHELEEENADLRLSFGVLLQVLRTKNIVSEEQYAAIVSAADRAARAAQAQEVAEVDAAEPVSDDLIALAKAKDQPS